MKTVIRKGVFETNSSSTHSLSLKNSNSNDENEEVSFEIRSKEAKIALLLGLVENAEMEYSSKFYYLDEDESLFKLKDKIISQIKNTQDELLENINLKEISFYDLSKLILKMDDSSAFSYEFFNDVEYEVSMLFLQEALDKKTVLKFKEAIVNEYCHLTGLTKEEALLEIDYAEFADTTLRDILRDEATAKEKLEEYSQINSSFKNEYNASSDKNIVEFAKKFFYDDYMKFKKLTEEKYHCDRYFAHGCLIECDCGFQNYASISDSFSLDPFNDEQIQKEAEKYLSDSVKINAKECYCGLIFEETGEIY